MVEAEGCPTCQRQGQGGAKLGGESNNNNSRITITIGIIIITVGIKITNEIRITIGTAIRIAIGIIIIKNNDSMIMRVANLVGILQPTDRQTDRQTWTGPSRSGNVSTVDCTDKLYVLIPS
jgi:hypothetical protein